MATNWKEIETILDISGGPVLLYGPPGTGKTTAGYRSLLRTNTNRASPYAITLTDDTSVAEVIGMFVPNKDGGFSWHDGPAMRAWREGKGLLINEIALASGSVLTALYAICDDAAVARLTLPNGETLQPTLGFRVIATMNDEPNTLPDALKDRFAIRLHITSPHPAALQELEPHQAGFLNRVYEAAEITGKPEASLREYKAFLALNSTLHKETAAAAVWGRRGHDVLSAMEYGVRDEVEDCDCDSCKRSREE